jgi:hypothetical protein
MRSDTTPDVDALAARLDAVERAVTDDEATEFTLETSETATDSRPPSTGSESSPVAESPRAAESRANASEDRVATLEDRVATLEADLAALRGLVGGVRERDESVERRADIALAKVERLERSMQVAPGLEVERIPVSGTPDAGGEGSNGSGSPAVADTESPTDDDDGSSLGARLRGVL